MDIFEAILASTSLFTAFVTAWVMIQQYLLQKKQLNAQQLEHQPLFEFIHKADGSLLIRNTGVAMSSPAIITVHSLLVMEYSRHIKKHDICLDYIYSIWVEKYTNPRHYTNLQGDIFFSESLLEKKEDVVNWKLSMIRDAINQSKTEVEELKALDVRLMDLVKIEYADRYKIRRILYFAEGNEISREFYDRVLVSAGNLTKEPRSLAPITTTEILDALQEFEYIIR